MVSTGSCWNARELTTVTLAEPDGESVGPLDLFDLPRHPDTHWWTEAVERWWCIGDDRNRTAVWVQGRKVM